MNCGGRTATLDVSRKVVPDKGKLNREPPVIKALRFESNLERN